MTKIEYELELENIFSYAANGTGSFIFYGTGISADKTYIADESPAQIEELINAAKA